MTFKQFLSFLFHRRQVLWQGIHNRIDISHVSYHSFSFILMLIYKITISFTKFWYDHYHYYQPLFLHTKLYQQSGKYRTLCFPIALQTVITSLYNTSNPQKTGLQSHSGATWLEISCQSNIDLPKRLSSSHKIFGPYGRITLQITAALGRVPCEACGPVFGHPRWLAPRRERRVARLLRPVQTLRRAAIRTCPIDGALLQTWK